MISVYSSFSKDKIMDEGGKIMSVRKGGPAYFIERIFKKYRFSYLLKTEKAIEVEIKLSPKGEMGRVKNKLKTKRIRVRNTRKPVLISTTGKEWMLKNNIPEDAKVFLDIQGYVRDLRRFGKKTSFNAPFLSEIFCIKGTKKEISYLPKNIIEKQKDKCLIITKGSEGAFVYYEGKKFLFKPKTKVIQKMAIGAGDVFFASFVLNFIKSNGNIIKSGRAASKEVVEFLKG